MNYNKILQEVFDEVSQLNNTGKAATYIPELCNISPNKFGICSKNIDGEIYSVGDSHEKFSIQSISKVLSLAYAMQLVDDEKVWKRLSVEPSGDPFNSLIDLELESGRPRNPLINAGALVVADVLINNLENPKQDFLNFVRKISGCPTIDFDEKVALSEKNTGFRNIALANFLKSFGNIHNSVEEVLDFYFYQCSLSMSCEELASAFLLFANHGVILHTGERILTISQTKRINAIMQTCGFYDEAGEFAFRVGLPGKSGVGGGIAAVHPRHYSVVVWSPKLNPKGNSFLGMEALERLTTKTGFSIF